MEYRYLKKRADLVQEIDQYPPLIIDTEAEITPEIVSEYIEKWRHRIPRYRYLRDMYLDYHPIYWATPKPFGKPDNRATCNYAKTIVDSFEGFHLGIPVKKVTKDNALADRIAEIDAFNMQDDKDSELSKLASIYGHSYELIYLDEEARYCTAYMSPMESCVIYDDSISKDPVFAFRVYKDSDGNEHGSYCTLDKIVYFDCPGTASIKVTGEEDNPFGRLPIIEYVQNEEQQAVFENSASMIEQLDKALSEKCNDVDYFADSYLKVLGAELEDEKLAKLRDMRVINLEGYDSNVVCDFMQKPSGDATQENLIERLTRNIFQIAMVANLTDENFGNASGTALRYKLWSMSNLAKYKARKFSKSMQERYRVMCSAPNWKGSQDDWMNLSFEFSQNYPANLLEEAQIASLLSGIVSEQTQLKILSIVDDVKEEMKLKEEENKTDDYPIARSRVLDEKTESTESGDTEERESVDERSEEAVSKRNQRA